MAIPSAMANMMMRWLTGLTPEEKASVQKDMTVYSDAIKSRSGNHATELVSKDELVCDFEHVGRKKTMSLLEITVGNPPYLAHSPPLPMLKDILIRDLKLGAVHHGRVLFGRLIVDAVRIRTSPASAYDWISLTLIEDETKAVQLLHIRHLDFSISLADHLPKGAMVTIKEPFFKVNVDGRQSIWINHLSDLVMIEPPKLRNDAICVDLGLADVAEKLKLQGNRAVAQKDWMYALRCYTLGIASTEFLPNSEILKSLRLNRALVNLHLNRYDFVLQDTELILATLPKNDKALLRSAEALYKLEEFEKSRGLISVLRRIQPDNLVALKLLRRSKLRLEEQDYARYDFEKIFKNVLPNSPRVDAATFEKTVTVKSTETHSLTLFATQAMAPGDIVLVEKAFATVYEQESNYAWTMDVNIGTEAPGHASVLANQVINKCVHNPSLYARLISLQEKVGIKPSREGKDCMPPIIDGEPLMDYFTLEDIQDGLAEKCPLKSADYFHDGPVWATVLRDDMWRRDNIHSSGLWLKAALIRHSCLPNSHKSFLGDMVIIRASRTIEKGEEITISKMQPSNCWDMRNDMLKGAKPACCCKRCEAEHKEPRQHREQRHDLYHEFRALHREMSDGCMTATQANHFRQLIKHLEGCYSENLYQDTPRFELHFVCYTFARYRMQRYLRGGRRIDRANEIEQAEKLLIKSLRALGFKVKLGAGGTSIQEFDVSKAHITKSTVDVFLSLTAIAGVMGKAHQRQIWVRHAKLYYKIVCGEDASFKEDGCVDFCF